jgi:hypothetical protein
MKTFRPNVDPTVGHDIYDFDLKFILKRSIIHGVRPTVDLSFARYRNQPIFDTMYQWGRWSYGSRGGLETLVRALDFESSKQNGVSGSQIHSLFEAGEHRVIHDYYLSEWFLRNARQRLRRFEDTAVGFVRVES